MLLRETGEMVSDYDVIVVGGGHAGVEAAHAAVRLGCTVGLCTLSRETVAHMPCNPAVGGTAKGHLVREIDALGGLMGQAIDATAIQFKLLNRSRGPAVWSPRAQADKQRYGEWMRARLEREPNIGWIVERAGAPVIEGGRVVGVELENGDRYGCRALVVTTGTFLNGLVHVGREQQVAGRVGEPASRMLGESLKRLGLVWGRLKTGHAATARPAEYRLQPIRGGAWEINRRCRFPSWPARSRDHRSAVTSCIQTRRFTR